MRCPFLRESQVKSCQASSFRKVIPRSADSGSDELCSTPAHVTCSAVRSHHEGIPSPERCPFLHESLVQYCAAAAVPTYVPYSESSISRCGNDTHLYCELYLALAVPSGGSPLEAVPGGGHATVDGVDVPEGLGYAQNHLWMDVSPDGTCHVGVDAFLARVLGQVDEITFLTTKGTVRPSVRLSVNGVDLPLVFPRAIKITAVNSALRVHPERLVADPYGSGWLFEGTLPEEKAKKPQASPEPPSPFPTLLPGPEAEKWIHDEVSRLNLTVHEIASRPDPDGLTVMADGGSFAAGLPKHLTREETMRLFDAFFSSEAALLGPAREVNK